MCSRSMVREAVLDTFTMRRLIEFGWVDDTVDMSLARIAASRELLAHTAPLLNTEIVLSARQRPLAPQRPPERA